MIIELLDGTRYDIEDYSLKRLYHRIPSVGVEHSTDSVEGRDGDIFIETRFNNRVISVELLYIARDIFDYYLLRDEINGLFARKETFYIIFKKEPYKRWKVRLATPFETEPHPHMRSFTVEFITVQPFAESVGTSLELAEQNFDSGLWGFGSRIDVDIDYEYVFNQSNFTVHNIGNVPIDPREHEIEITLKGTFSNGVTIKNTTTGDEYKYNGALSSTDELKISGVRTFKNGTSDFRRTNHKLITLGNGANNFTVEGGTVNSIAFNFRFLYL